MRGCHVPSFGINAWDHFFCMWKCRIIKVFYEFFKTFYKICFSPQAATSERLRSLEDWWGIAKLIVCPTNRTCAGGMPHPKPRPLMGTTETWVGYPLGPQGGRHHVEIACMWKPWIPIFYRRSQTNSQSINLDEWCPRNLNITWLGTEIGKFEIIIRKISCFKSFCHQKIRLIIKEAPSMFCHRGSVEILKPLESRPPYLSMEMESHEDELIPRISIIMYSS